MLYRLRVRLEQVGKHVTVSVRGRERRVSYGGPEPFAVTNIDTQRFASAQLAVDSVAPLVAELQAQGYRAPGRGGDPDRNPALEASLRTARDNGVYAVYADWLQQRGHPLGELIAAELANQQRPEIRIDFGSTDPERYIVRWKSGLWSVLSLRNLTSSGTVYDPLALAREVFQRCACTALEELHIGRNRDDAMAVPAIIDAAGDSPWAAALRSLVLGGDEELQHFRVGKLGDAIRRAFPDLEQLHISSGEFDLERLRLPKLRSLHLETIALLRKTLRHVLAGPLTELRDVVLWCGAPAEGCDVGVRDLEPLWKLPLTALTICNFYYADELARTLDLPTLETLDLSKGTLDDAAVRVLIANRDRFPALQAFDVSESYLGAGAIAALREAFAGVELNVRAQRVTDGDGERYVAMAERIRWRRRMSEARRDVRARRR